MDASYLWYIVLSFLLIDPVLENEIELLHLLVLLVLNLVRLKIVYDEWTM